MVAARSRRLTTAAALALLLVAPFPPPAAASLDDRSRSTWASPWRRDEPAAQGGLYAEELEDAGWAEEREEIKEEAALAQHAAAVGGDEDGSDYVTELLGAQERARRRLQAACDTVYALSAAVATAAVTHATDGTGATFAMAASNRTQPSTTARSPTLPAGDCLR